MSSAGRAGRTATQPVAPQGRHGDDAVLRRLRRADRAAARGIAARSRPSPASSRRPFDILADKLRGYLGLAMDLFDAADKVLAACEALMPHLLHVALATADPEQTGADRLLDAPRLRAVRLARAVREHLLADASSRSSRSFGPTAIRRSSTPRASGTTPGVVRRTARPEHRLPRRPGRHLRGPSRAGRQVLPQRRRAQRPAGLRHAGRRRGLLQEESSTAWPATAATSWTPARSCRTTPGSRTSGR